MAKYQDKKGKSFKTRAAAKASNLSYDSKNKDNLKKQIDILQQVVGLQKQVNQKRASEPQRATDAEIDAWYKQGLTEGSMIPGRGVLLPDGSFDTTSLNKPKGEVLGASTDSPSDVGMFGTDATDEASDYEGGTFEAGPETLKKTKVNSEMERSLNERYGGNSGGGTRGMSLYNADKIAQQRAQVSSGVTYAFNPETLKKTQRAIDKFGFALDEVSNSPFEPKQYKQDAKNNLIEVTSKELGQMFTDPNEIYSAYQFNPQFKATLDKFIQKGGTIEGVAKNVSTPPVGTSEGQNVQDSATYLANLRNPQANQEAEKMALEELSPESDIAQEEIMRQAKIPSELKTLYFGDEKSIGIVQMRRKQAEEEARVLEEREKDEKKTARDRAELQIERNKADVKIAEAKIEENRLAAKNYMTAKLASLGALQTTGAAPLAIQTLETKYQTEVSNLRTKLKFANREVEIGMNETLDKIENDTDDKILKIQEDLTKDSETIAKEVLKAQNDAEKQIYTITEQYARRLRERTTKYTDDLKAAAEKQAKEYAKLASGGIDFTSVGNVTSKSKIVSTIERMLENSRGSDGYVNSEVYAKALKDWIAKGGTTRSFVAAFPTKLYSNPNDTSLPPALSYAKESQTLPRESNDDDELTYEEIMGG